jgi:zinc/manganese transport system substrate-binding protein
MRRGRLGAGLLAAVALAAGGCGSSGDTSDAGSTTASSDSPVAGGCPTAAVDVVVTVDQWGDIVSQLAGECAEVTTIIQGGDVDPHDFEPTPADTAAFAEADLVVMNGLDYDHWAEDAVDSAASEPAVVDAGEVVGLAEGDNPHVWYGPDYVAAVGRAVTAELEALAPDAAEYFEARATAWDAELKAYLDEVESVKQVADGTTYGATESVFEYMADAVGLVDETPEGFKAAAANESDPAPADVNAFEEALRDGAMAVLVYNTQTEGSLPEQVRGVAEGAHVPVVEVTESVPPGQDSFFAWQVSQLRALAEALGG